MVLAGIATTAAYKYLNICQYSISEYISVVVPNENNIVFMSKCWKWGSLAKEAKGG